MDAEKVAAPYGNESTIVTAAKLKLSNEEMSPAAKPSTSKELTYIETENDSVKPASELQGDCGSLAIESSNGSPAAKLLEKKDESSPPANEPRLEDVHRRDDTTAIEEESENGRPGPKVGVIPEDLEVNGAKDSKLRPSTEEMEVSDKGPVNTLESEPTLAASLSSRDESKMEADSGETMEGSTSNVHSPSTTQDSSPPSKTSSARESRSSSPAVSAAVSSTSSSAIATSKAAPSSPAASVLAAASANQTSTPVRQSGRARKAKQNDDFVTSLPTKRSRR